MIKISLHYIIIRCVNCSALYKIRINQFMETCVDAYCHARAHNESEIIVVCDSCRKKQTAKEEATKG